MTSSVRRHTAIDYFYLMCYNIRWSTFVDMHFDIYYPTHRKT